MIENYFYSISKKKKIAYGILITLFVFSLTTFKTQSGLFSWAAQEITDNITNEIFESLNQSIAEGVGKILDFISNVFTAPWGPQLGTFAYYTGAGGASAVNMIENFGIWIGVFIATIIYFFSMFTYFFSGKITDSKDTPISLTFRYVVAMAICYKLKTIVATFLNIIDMINEGYVKNALASTMGEAGFLTLLGEAIDGHIKRTIVGSVALLIPGVNLIIIIFVLFAVWKILKGLFKLYSEMIARYILSCFSLMLFGGFAGTIVSNNTAQIFKSYIQSLFGTFFVLLFNILWFKVCMLTIVGMINSCSVLQYFFLLELMAFGLKIDGYLRSMGLNVAASSSRIASAAGSGARNLANALRIAGDARRGGGTMLKEMGAAMAAKGNPNGMKMFEMGSRLSAGTQQGDILKGRGNSENAAFNMAASLGANGMKVADNAISGMQAADIMSRAMKNPADKDAQNAIRALSNNKLAEGAQAIVGDGYKVNNASFTNKFGADGQRHAGIKIDATPVNADGSEGKSFAGTISGDGMFQDGVGTVVQTVDDDLYMQRDPVANSMSKGEKVPAMDLEEFGGSAAAEALESSKGFDFTDGEIVSMGDKSFRCFDSEGNMFGTISGDEFIANASNEIDGIQASDSMLSVASKKINSMGYNVSEFTPVAGQYGVYQATGTDEDGNTKTFTATDRGVYTDSKLNSDTESFRIDALDAAENRTSMNVNASNYKEGSTSSNGSEASAQTFGSGGSDNNSTPDSYNPSNTGSAQGTDINNSSSYNASGTSYTSRGSDNNSSSYNTTTINQESTTSSTSSTSSSSTRRTSSRSVEGGVDYKSNSGSRDVERTSKNSGRTSKDSSSRTRSSSTKSPQSRKK